MRLMQQLLFLTVMAGIIVAADAIRFDGRYRTEIWQQATHTGEVLNRGATYALRRLW
jgi:hypothetical protein